MVTVTSLTLGLNERAAITVNQVCEPLVPGATGSLTTSVHREFRDAGSGFPAESERGAAANKSADPACDEVLFPQRRAAPTIAGEQVRRLYGYSCSALPVRILLISTAPSRRIGTFPAAARREFRRLPSADHV